MGGNSRLEQGERRRDAEDQASRTHEATEVLLWHVLQQFEVLDVHNVGGDNVS